LRALFFCPQQPAQRNPARAPAGARPATTHNFRTIEQKSLGIDHISLACDRKMVVSDRKSLAHGRKMVVTDQKSLVHGRKMVASDQKSLVYGRKMVVSDQKSVAHEPGTASGRRQFRPADKTKAPCGAFVIPPPR
jgi:hypothetical protein